MTSAKNFLEYKSKKYRMTVGGPDSLSWDVGFKTFRRFYSVVFHTNKALPKEIVKQNIECFEKLIHIVNEGIAEGDTMTNIIKFATAYNKHTNYSKTMVFMMTDKLFDIKIFKHYMNFIMAVVGGMNAPIEVDFSVVQNAEELEQFKTCMEEIKNM